MRRPDDEGRPGKGGSFGRARMSAGRKHEARSTPSALNRDMNPNRPTGNVETLYMLTSPATDSIENMSLDAERRARERGCECIAPTFLHLIGRDQISCIVDHHAYCPLSGVKR